MMLAANTRGKAMKNHRALLVAAIVLFWLQTSTSAQESPKYKELPNFHQVRETLFRGGQPKDGGLQKLKQLGRKLLSTFVTTRQKRKALRLVPLECNTLVFPWRVSDARMKRQ